MNPDLLAIRYDNGLDCALRLNECLDLADELITHYQLAGSAPVNVERLKALLVNCLKHVNKENRHLNSQI